MQPADAVDWLAVQQDLSARLGQSDRETQKISVRWLNDDMPQCLDTTGQAPALMPHKLTIQGRAIGSECSRPRNVGTRAINEPHQVAQHRSSGGVQKSVIEAWIQKILG